MSAISNEVKQRLDIVSVVSESTPLARSGRNFKACCPFHTEKTPSFYVFPDSQTWRCFGQCASGGDVISFTMKKEGLDFSTALRQLAARAGVEYHEKRQDPVEVDHLERLRGANEAAARYFHNQLLHAPEAEHARAYVAKRQITPEATFNFLLGYAPAGYEALKRHLEGQGYTTAELLEAGLMVEGDRGPYDRFRDRLMFPIRDVDGRVVAFGARALRDDQQPKYLNSSQSPIFDKSGTLYALDKARNAIRQSHVAVIVEGYMDALTAHEHGYANVVASMGTALTEKQVSQLGRTVDRIVLALDADAAGQNAILRGLETAPAALGEESVAVPAWKGRVRWQKRDGKSDSVKLPDGVVNIVSRQKGEIRVLQLPHGKDPDELIRTTPDVWESLVADAMPMMDFVLLAAQRRFDLHDPKGKSDAAEMVMPFLAQMPNTVEQAHYTQKLAGLLGVPENALLNDVAQSRPKAPAPGRQPHRSEPAPQTNAPMAVRAHLEKSELLEDYCLALLLHEETLRLAGAQLRPDHFLSTETRALFETWRDEPDRLLDHEALGPDLAERLEDVLATTLPPMKEAQAQAAFAQCLRRLEERRLRDLKMHHRLRFVQEEQELGANELAARAYARWQEEQQADDAEDAALVDVQEQEVAINRQLQHLMEQNHARRPHSELPVIP